MTLGGADKGGPEAVVDGEAGGTNGGPGPFGTCPCGTSGAHGGGGGTPASPMGLSTIRRPVAGEFLRFGKTFHVKIENIT
jgi:hypothetical protein